jgi:peptide/nickel transport system permease protein
MMLRFVLKRVAYGFLLLLGVITLVFFLFTVLPSDPARMMMGQRSDIATEEAIRKEMGLDLPIGIQYLAYLNDLSPISWHKTKDTESFFYLNNENYHYTGLISFDESAVVLKTPYLRRSYQSKRPVSEILTEAFPKTALLAFVSIVLHCWSVFLSAYFAPYIKEHGSINAHFFSLFWECLSLRFSQPSSSHGFLPSCWQTTRD